MNQRGSVYIIGECGADRPVKIGCAINPEARLAAVQIGNYRRLELLFAREFETASHANAAERQVHRLFSAKRMQGEWFDVSWQEAKAAVASTIAPNVVPKKSRKDRVIQPGLLRAIKVVGGQTNLARRLNISREAIGQWLRCPAERVMAVSAATNGVVAPQELRPDIFAPIQEHEDAA